MEISIYFKMNDMDTRKFKRTLIVVDERSSATYIEGCIAPFYDTNHLHATVVDLYCTKGATIKYSTVNNWYVGDEECRRGIYNFIMKICLCDGDKSRNFWICVETGLTIT